MTPGSLGPCSRCTITSVSDSSRQLHVNVQLVGRCGSPPLHHLNLCSLCSCALWPPAAPSTTLRTHHCGGRWHTQCFLWARAGVLRTAVRRPHCADPRSRFDDPRPRCDHRPRRDRPRSASPASPASTRRSPSVHWLPEVRMGHRASRCAGALGLLESCTGAVGVWLLCAGLTVESRRVAHQASHCHSFCRESTVTI
jgi:hypothetical protein